MDCLLLGAERDFSGIYFAKGGDSTLKGCPVEILDLSYNQALCLPLDKVFTGFSPVAGTMLSVRTYNVREKGRSFHNRRWLVEH